MVHHRTIELCYVSIAIAIAIAVSRPSENHSPSINQPISPRTAVMKISEMFEERNGIGRNFDKGLDVLISDVIAGVEQVVTNTIPQPWSEDELIRFDKMCINLFPVINVGIDLRILTHETTLGTIRGLANLFTNSTTPARIVLLHMLDSNLRRDFVARLPVENSTVPLLPGRDWSFWARPEKTPHALLSYSA